MRNLTARLFKARRTPSDAGGDHNCQFAPVQTILVPQGKQPFQKSLCKSIDHTIGRIAADHNGTGVADFLGQLREIVLDLADVVLFASKAGDTGAYVDLAEFDKL